MNHLRWIFSQVAVLAVFFAAVGCSVHGSPVVSLPLTMLLLNGECSAGFQDNNQDGAGQTVKKQTLRVNTSTREAASGTSTYFCRKDTGDTIGDKELNGKVSNFCNPCSSKSLGKGMVT